MNVDVGSKTYVESKKSKAKLQEEQEIEDLKTVLSHVSGRSFIWRILQECGVYRETYSPDHSVVSFREGKRKIGLWLLVEIHNVAPNAYVQMQQEALKREERS